MSRERSRALWDALSDDECGDPRTPAHNVLCRVQQLPLSPISFLAMSHKNGTLLWVALPPARSIARSGVPPRSPQLREGCV
jgi:hypothetical protein